MREIIFRGKRKDNGKWIYGGYFVDDEKHFIITRTRYIPDTRDWDTADYYENNPTYTYIFNEVASNTVGQYIGLTDKSGVNKIFDGDIIKIDYFNDYIMGQVVYNKITRGFEFWYESVVGAYGEKALHKMNFSRFRDCEVIGNIHDNIELLNN